MGVRVPRSAEQAGGVTVTLAGDGVVVRRRGGQRTEIKVGETGTGGAYALHVNTAPAGFGGVPFHLHRDADEGFYVLEGELTVYSAPRPLQTCR
jgi:uncharacterized cupin superfamily protein